MNHKGTAVLNTERLILRRYRLQDAESAFQNWMSSEAVTRYLTWPPYADVDEARGYIQSVIDGYTDTVYNWVIEDRASRQAIGSISVITFRDDTACAEIGYCLGERYWGRGIMTEALGAVIRYLFDEVGCRRIQATHDANNPASGRVMEKCGLRYEGTLRQAGRNNQGICDEVIRAILKEDIIG